MNLVDIMEYVLVNISDIQHQLYLHSICNIIFDHWQIVSTYLNMIEWEQYLSCMHYWKFITNDKYTDDYTAPTDDKYADPKMMMTMVMTTTTTWLQR